MPHPPFPRPHAGGPPTAMLRIQQDRAEQLADDLLAKMRRHERIAQPDPVATALTKLLAVVRIHLRQEESSLLPDLLASPDPHVRDTARRFRREMVLLADAVENFAARWRHRDAIERQYDHFRDETTDLLTQLAERIRSENDELYPLVERGGTTRERNDAPMAIPPAR